MKKVFLIIFILCILTVPLSHVVSAQVLTREQTKLDERLHSTEKMASFAMPESIVIAPIEKINNYHINSIDWFKAIYYYMAGRLGLGDIQFHYVITSDGLVFQGIKNGVEQKGQLLNGPDNPIIIAYLSEINETDFSFESINPLSDLIIDLANKNAIPLSKVFIKRIKFSNIENTFTMTAQDMAGKFNLTIENIKRQLVNKYNPVKREYKIEVKEVNLSKQEVDPGADVKVSLKIRNIGEYSIFKGTDAEIIAQKKDNSVSLFYINGTWSSPSQVEIMTSGVLLRPGEEATYEFKLNVPLYFGEQTETFLLTDLNGNLYQDTEFNISIKINRINVTVVEILDTETGTLNVRDRASGYGNIITTVLPGQRFIEKQRTDTGWVLIDLGNGTTGWVSARYVKIV